jgi:hypothetical protein
LLSRLVIVLLYARLAVGKRYLRKIPETSTLEIEPKRVSRGVFLKDTSAPHLSQLFSGLFF